MRRARVEAAKPAEAKPSELPKFATGGPPKLLRQFAHKDELHSQSGIVQVPDGWEATDGHRLAWQRAKHGAPPAFPTYLDGPEKGNGTNHCSQGLFGNGYVPKTWRAAVLFRVEKAARYLNSWPLSLETTVKFERIDGEVTATVDVKHRTEELPVITLIRARSEELERHFEMSPHVSEFATNPRYTAAAMLFAGGVVWRPLDQDNNLEPMIFAHPQDLASVELGMSQSWEQLRTAERGCIVMPCRF